MRGFWGLLLAASFVAGLTVSWQRWASPVIDSGREMNQPLRLAEGQRLYSDVRHIYGPFSPWLNAQLYRAFGPSLGVLYGDGHHLVDPDPDAGVPACAAAHGSGRCRDGDDQRDVDVRDQAGR